MTTPTPVPVLGTQGFATDSVTKFSMLMSHLYLADAKQSYLYAGQVTTLAEILERSGGDQQLICNNLKTSLGAYFSRYYDSATVTASVLNPDDASGALTIQLVIKVFDQGQDLTQAWRFDATNNVISNVLSVNNYGS